MLSSREPGEQEHRVRPLRIIQCAEEPHRAEDLADRLVTLGSEREQVPTSAAEAVRCPTQRLRYSSTATTRCAPLGYLWRKQDDADLIAPLPCTLAAIRPNRRAGRRITRRDGSCRGPVSFSDFSLGPA